MNLDLTNLKACDIIYISKSKGDKLDKRDTVTNKLYQNIQIKGGKNFEGIKFI